MLLLAQDAGELPTISALVQDMAVKAGDVSYDRRARRLALLGNRFRHEARGATRTRTLLRIGSVLRAERRSWPADSETVLALLAITHADETVTLSFANGATIRLTVEWLDAMLEDVAGPWGARRRPRHE